MQRDRPISNHLLRALPAEERARWEPHLQPVDMTLGSVIYESDATLDHMYFPTTSIVSLLNVMRNGNSTTLYARVDLVPSEDGSRLMELELIEPDLALRLHPDATEAFALVCRKVLSAPAEGGHQPNQTCSVVRAAGRPA
jgi:hypothetical protein